MALARPGAVGLAVGLVAGKRFGRVRGAGEWPAAAASSSEREGLVGGE